MGLGLLKALLLPLVLCLPYPLSAQGSLLPPAPVDLPPGDGGRWLLLAHPGERVELPLRLAPGAQGARVGLRLADPCAKGTARCPGWDASRYPWVEHTREAFTLTPTSPEARFRFWVDPKAPSQGPLKWEVVVRDGGREWAYPLYLRVRDRGVTGLEALAAWRERAGLPPLSGEDLEGGWGGWLHGRYEVANGNQAPPHDEDPSHPFHTPEGQGAARSNLSYSVEPMSPDSPWSLEVVYINRLVTAPFHRLSLTVPTPFTPAFGIYRAVGTDPWFSSGPGPFRLTLAVLRGHGGPSPRRESPFPPPGMRLPVNGFGSESPNPKYPCHRPEQVPRPPFLSQRGLPWLEPDGQPRHTGFPITLTTYQEAETEVLEARLVRLRDGVENPVCAFGSEQFWESMPFWRDVGISVLRSHGAVFVLPYEPLTPGAGYKVYLKARVGSRTLERSWRFAVDAVLWEY